METVSEANNNESPGDYNVNNGRSKKWMKFKQFGR